MGGGHWLESEAELRNKLGCAIDYTCQGKRSSFVFSKISSYSLNMCDGFFFLNYQNTLLARRIDGTLNRFWPLGKRTDIYRVDSKHHPQLWPK
jgi:hypothetical protein